MVDSKGLGDSGSVVRTNTNQMSTIFHRNLQILLINCFILINAQPSPQTSFDATVFDLNPNLPIESVYPPPSPYLQQQQPSTDQTSLVNTKNEIDSVSLSKLNTDNIVGNNNRGWFRDHYNISGR